ncbi:MAG: Hsp70 family protein, partial [Candidatus Competibacteraceae bacterium]|nr:Hsp70 family protein [Candidatus Competibacteraceae bacterium]
KDKATGKEQSIVIKASSGLSDEEIDKMVKDAEAHAEEDRKFRELVDVRNQGENLIHATEKTLKDLGEKVDSAERGQIESAMADLRTALKGDNQSAIESKSQTLAELSGKLAERVYAQTSEDQPDASGQAKTDGGSKDEGVVDAEFEEVKDK